jgi:hypothetical protein
MELARPRQLALGDFENTTIRPTSPVGPSSLITDSPVPQSAWADDVERFLHWKGSETSVDEDWIKQMR